MKLSLRFIQKQLPEKEVLYMRGGSPAILCGQIRFWEEGRKCSRKCIYLISANSFVKCVREKILLPPNLICTASWAALSGIREKTGRFSPDASVLVVSSEHSREYWMNRPHGRREAEIFRPSCQRTAVPAGCAGRADTVGGCHWKSAEPVSPQRGGRALSSGSGTAEGGAGSGAGRIHGQSG